MRVNWIAAQEYWFTFRRVRYRAGGGERNTSVRAPLRRKHTGYLSADIPSIPYLNKAKILFRPDFVKPLVRTILEAGRPDYRDRNAI